MISSRHNDLRSWKRNLKQEPADPESTGVIQRRILTNDVNVARFSSSPATDDAQRYLRPPFREPPQSPPLKFSFLPLGITITRKELDIIKLTAQFVAVFGMYFRRELTERVLIKNPLFEFLNPTDSRYRFYMQLALGYSRVLIMCSQKLGMNSASTGAVFDSFCKLLDQVLEKQKGKEEEPEMAMTDLYAFEYFANFSNTQNDLQCFYLRPQLRDPPQSPPLKFAFLPSGITITRKEVDIIKLTAQFVAVYGMYFQLDLEKKVSKNPQFEFVKSTDSKYPFYTRLVDGYKRVLMRSIKQTLNSASFGDVLDGFFKLLDQVLEKEGVEMAMTDLHAFEYFANMEDNLMMNPPPHMQPPLGSQFAHLQVPQPYVPPTGIMQPVPATVAIIEPRPEVRSMVEKTALLVSKNGMGSFGLGFRFPEKGITLKKLGIIKLTAQFMARYGMYFQRDLKKRVVGNPQFEFMESTDSRFSFYNGLVFAYSRVLMPSKVLRKSDDCTATVLEGFFRCIQLEKQEEEGVDMDMIDLHALVRGVDYFACLEDEDYAANVPQPQHLSTQMQPGMLVHPPLGSQFSQLQVSPPPPMPAGTSPPPPLPLHDESELVPEDQFLVQHPGSATVDDGWQVIDITVQSLPENVASLKEKTEGDPNSSKQVEVSLSGKAGF